MVRVVCSTSQALEYALWDESHTLKEILLINISGADKAGLTVAVADILAGFDVNVLDIGQAVIHDTLSLGVLVELPTPAEQSSLLKDILFYTSEQGMQARFTPITEESYERCRETFPGCCACCECATPYATRGDHLANERDRCTIMDCLPRRAAAGCATEECEGCAANLDELTPVCHLGGCELR